MNSEQKQLWVSDFDESESELQAEACSNVKVQEVPPVVLADIWITFQEHSVPWSQRTFVSSSIAERTIFSLN